MSLVRADGHVPSLAGQPAVVWYKTPEHRAAGLPATGVADLCMALRTVPRGSFRDLGKRRLPADKLAEKILAEAILEHLQLCGWRLEHRGKPGVTPR